MNAVPSTSSPVTAPLLSVQDLTVRYRHPQRGRDRWVWPVRELSFSLNEGDVFCLVGESGSGKTTAARAVVGLAPVWQGTVAFQGQAMSRASGWTRGLVQMVFQDPAGSLNPRRPAWWLVSEPAALSAPMSETARRVLAARLLDAVGMPGAFAERLPHQLSGGQRQRLAIARALSTNARLLVLDEPTSALDMTVQAQVLDLLLALQQSLGLSYLLITHNLSVVRHLGTHVAVMQRGELVEQGLVTDVLNAPSHPFTRRLLAAVPSLLAPGFLDNTEV